MVPGLLSAGDIEAITADLERLASLHESDRHHRDRPSAGTRHLNDLAVRSTLVADAVTRPALIELVRAVIGEVPQPTEVGWRCPQPGFGGQSLHADDLPKLDAGPDRVATAIIALVDFTADNGATRVVPGSHRRPDLQQAAAHIDTHPDEVVLTGPAGAAFVFSGHLLHAGGRNRSDHDRSALQVVWRATS